MYACSIFLADSIIGQKDRKVNYGTVLYHHRPGDPCGNAVSFPMSGKTGHSRFHKMLSVFSCYGFTPYFFSTTSLAHIVYIGRLLFSSHVAILTAYFCRYFLLTVLLPVFHRIQGPPLFPSDHPGNGEVPAALPRIIR